MTKIEVFGTDGLQIAFFQGENLIITREENLFNVFEGDLFIGYINPYNISIIKFSRW